MARKRHTAPPAGVPIQPDPDAKPRVFTVYELAERWRIDRHTVAAEIRKGILKGFKAGRQYRIFEADVLSYEQQVRAVKAAS